MSSPLGWPTRVIPRYFTLNTIPSNRVSFVSVQFSGSSGKTSSSQNKVLSYFFFFGNRHTFKVVHLQAHAYHLNSQKSCDTVENGKPKAECNHLQMSHILEKFFSLFQDQFLGQRGHSKDCWANSLRYSAPATCELAKWHHRSAHTGIKYRVRFCVTLEM